MRVGDYVLIKNGKWQERYRIVKATNLNHTWVLKRERLPKSKADALRMPENIEWQNLSMEAHKGTEFYNKFYPH